MRSLPTTTVTLMGGESTKDTYGDEDESSAVLAAGVPASLVEGTMRAVGTESDMQAVTVRYYVCRLPQTIVAEGGAVVPTPVNELSRVKDERTGDIFAVDVKTVPLHPTTAQDIRLDLRRVS